QHRPRRASPPAGEHPAALALRASSELTHLLTSLQFVQERPCFDPRESRRGGRLDGDSRATLDKQSKRQRLRQQAPIMRANRSGSRSLHADALVTPHVLISVTSGCPIFRTRACAFFPAAVVNASADDLPLAGLMARRSPTRSSIGKTLVTTGWFFFSGRDLATG